MDQDVILTPTLLFPNVYLALSKVDDNVAGQKSGHTPVSLIQKSNFNAVWEPVTVSTSKSQRGKDVEKKRDSGYIIRTNADTGKRKWETKEEEQANEEWHRLE